ncbi:MULTISPECIES: methylmalonyl Co-A mutase-associated GTPase MeaB [Niastella]|uniref:Methylmalonyl Co-A mutase-associated GTPase MeaB n=1 Tax=Niastella soli TaxID=2821487 RepID=A0ABS3YPX5_9BACT|nr:methylmalonyl Co-A mutase-associated GTPase MeaB [Niastella soli]MBO9199935.1 methylmalonyl Co-A mutase-associated GTPase MeaB [Niastella soli]
MQTKALVNWQQLLSQIQEGSQKAISRCLSLVENEVVGYDPFLANLPVNERTQIIGITGPPGAGKSTLTDALIGELVAAQKRVAVLCVDPSSPFNMGALLGDRIRMSEWYSHPNVFIRSLATRGSLGGLHPKIIELTEVLKAAPFDNIIIETVGVGQSEVEIAGLADATVVVLVPEAGDEVQTMKAGLMEIADIFVVNKADRPDADTFYRNLKLMLQPAFHATAVDIPVIKTIASQKKGIPELAEAINARLKVAQTTEKKFRLLSDKAFYLLQKHRMKDINKETLLAIIQKENITNVYSFITRFY